VSSPQSMSQNNCILFPKKEVKILNVDLKKILPFLFRGKKFKENDKIKKIIRCFIVDPLCLLISMKLLYTTQKNALDDADKRLLERRTN